MLDRHGARDGTLGTLMQPPETLSAMWPIVAVRLQQVLGQTCRSPAMLASFWSTRAAWSVSMPTFGDLVVKIRNGDRAGAKAQWSARNLPLLAKRGSPVPPIIWQGPLDEHWHMIVQRRLPGRSLRSMTWPMLDQIIELIELQADADPLPTSEDRDFSGYIAHVLFDDWDDVWRDASIAGPRAEGLCARLRDWLQPAWGLRLPSRDFTNNDLNLSNILNDGQHVTGIVDWDEFGLGTRAIDLVVLAFDCTRDGANEMADRLLARAAEIAGDDGLRCLVSYRAIAMLAEDARERLGIDGHLDTIERILDHVRGEP